MSDEETVTAHLSCPKCGAAPERDETLGDDGQVTCSNPDCDTRFGTWGEVQKQIRDHLVAQVKGEFQDTLEKAFKGSKNITYRRGS